MYQVGDFFMPNYVRMTDYFGDWRRRPVKTYHIIITPDWQATQYIYADDECRIGYTIHNVRTTTHMREFVRKMGETLCFTSRDEVIQVNSWGDSHDVSAEFKVFMGANNG